jgi:DNA-binding MarR family transcriptional regulator
MTRHQRPASDQTVASLAASIERQLRDIRQALHEPVEAAYATGNITGPQRLVLEQIARRPEGVGVAELARLLGMSHSTVSGIVDRLAKGDLARRSQNPGDRRYNLVKISPKVRSYVEEVGAHLTESVLITALRKASPQQRASIEAGIAALHRLVGPS